MKSDGVAAPDQGSVRNATDELDAKRYRWLREQNKDPVYADCVVINWNVGHDWQSADDLDAAIDAAIRALPDQKD